MTSVLLNILRAAFVDFWRSGIDADAGRRDIKMSVAILTERVKNCERDSVDAAILS